MVITTHTPRSVLWVFAFYISVAATSLALFLMVLAIENAWHGPMLAAEAEQRFLALTVVAVPMLVGWGVALWVVYFSKKVDADRTKTPALR